MMKEMECFAEDKIQRVRKSRKMFGLPMQLDAAIWMVVVAVIVAGVIVGAIHMTKEARAATARLEMDSLRSAILEYEAYTETTFNGTWSVLFSDFTDSSGDTHKALLQSKGHWKNNTPTDPWGTAYSVTGTVAAGNRKVQSTGSGETISVNL